MSLPNQSKGVVYFGVTVAALAIIGALVLTMVQLTQQPDVNAARVVERRKFLSDLQASNAEVLNSYGYADPVKGLVRLPVARAMELTIENWKDPAAGRADLLKRIEKANAAPPKAPEKPSAYE